MDGSSFIPLEIFNGVLLSLFALVPIVVLIVTARAGWGVGRVAQMSMRARLPLGAATMERSIRARTRTLMRVNMWGLLVAIGALAVVLVLTPLGGTPYFIWLFTIVLLFGVLTISAAVVNTRERLFSPAPAAPRVARVQSMRTADYVGRWIDRIPGWILLVSGLFAGGASIVALNGLVPMTALGWLGAAMVIAVGAAFIGRWAERRVIAQPQPASDTVELAWDDLFRTDALSILRMGAAMAAWFPLGLAAAMLMRAGLPLASSGWEAMLGLFPWWGIPIIQVVFLWRQGRLREPLYPAFLRAPDPRVA
ncbi:hypothetical protein QL996_09085 [Planococcus sp. APC 4015]|nr:hypothetical protein [Planococcus sp. APC 4015]